MAITKLQAEALNLADTYAFTGTVTGAGQTNQPSFKATLSSNQSMSDATSATVTFNNEIFDTASCYDTSNYRFTPNVAGKYLVISQVNCFTDAGTMLNVSVTLKKNGSDECFDGLDQRVTGGSPDAEASGYNVKGKIVTIVDMNGSSDYLSMTAYIDATGTIIVNGGLDQSYFSAYKLF
jgi:hypothetical protein